jgi:hypothetical protein
MAKKLTVFPSWASCVVDNWRKRAHLPKPEEVPGAPTDLDILNVLNEIVPDGRDSLNAEDTLIEVNALRNELGLEELDSLD